jgi:hypothetical protein
MQADELLGVPVELAADRAQITDPIIDRAMPGGRAHLAAVRDRAVLDVHGVGSFAIDDGRRIRFTPLTGAQPDAAKRWLHSTVAALLLAQRAQFALHASVVQIGGAAVAIGGARGAGKSTTALLLAQRGHRLVTDDVSVLTAGPPVMVHPLAHPVRVLPESAERLGLDTSDARRLQRQPKLALPAPTGPPIALAAIVVLGHDAQGEPTSTPLHGAEACWAVVWNTHRGSLYRPLWEAEMLEWARQVTSAVPVHRLTRPSDRWTAGEVGDAVERIASTVG